jgi:hypothetical protein
MLLMVVMMKLYTPLRFLSSCHNAPGPTQTMQRILRDPWVIDELQGRRNHVRINYFVVRVRKSRQSTTGVKAEYQPE